ncbi:hypothetical protein SESBI_14264 [Sesbania bispinosa]|nr:hypothetical protein SESBI_14264 [Sesbania bispinosa]
MTKAKTKRNEASFAKSKYKNQSERGSTWKMVAPKWVNSLQLEIEVRENHKQPVDFSVLVGTL